MITKYQQAYESLKHQLYAAYRYDHEIMMVKADQLAILLGLEPPESDEPNMGTAQLSEATMMAIARRDAAEDDTEPFIVGVYDDIEIGD